MGLTQTTAPSVEPVTTAQAKAHMRVDISDDDAYIDTLVKVACRSLEKFQGRQFITATWQLTLDDFPDDASEAIKLPYPPLQSITSIGYTDSNGSTQTFASTDYDVDTNAEPGRVRPAYGEVWPGTRDQMEAVTIVFKAGYGDAASNMPDDTIHTIKFWTALLYEARLPVTDRTILEVPYTLRTLMWQNRLLTDL